MKRSLLRLALPLLLLAGVAAAQTTELELGLRWVDLSGNEAMYRSQINEREGFVLRSFLFSSESGDQFLDRFRLSATDMGTTPAGAFRLEAAKDGAYTLRLGYRTFDAFNSLGTFANPLLSQGVVIGQHTLDQTRSMLDMELEIVPGRKITPVIGYSRAVFSGPRTTTYHLGQDEFGLTSDLDDTDQEYRGGINFSTSRFQGQVIQGWRDFKSTENLTLTSASAGNNANPVLGRPVSLESLTRFSRTRVSTPFTNAWITGELSSRVRVIGSYVQFEADTDGNESESSEGNLVSFDLGRYFEGLSEVSSSDAGNKTWRGEARTEISLRQGLDLLVGVRRENRELNGSSIISSVFADSITFGGADPRDFESVLQTRNALERDEQVLSATLSARALGPFAVRAGYSESDQEFIVTPDLAEIVIDGAGGTFDRRIRTFETLASFARSNVSVTTSWRRDRADQTIFRTDFMDRDRYRVRTAWAPKSFLRFGVSAEQLDQASDQDETGFEGKVRQYAADLEVAPLKMLSLRASASRFEADSQVAIIRPETFFVEQSIYAEKGTGYDGGFSLTSSKVTFDADAGRFENEGSIPFHIDRFRGRVVYDFAARTGVAAEWSRDDYVEEGTSFSDFEATRYGIFLRYRK